MKERATLLRQLLFAVLILGAANPVLAEESVAQAAEVDQTPLARGQCA